MPRCWYPMRPGRHWAIFILRVLMPRNTPLLVKNSGRSSSTGSMLDAICSTTQDRELASSSLNRLLVKNCKWVRSRMPRETYSNLPKINPTRTLQCATLGTEITASPPGASIFSTSAIKANGALICSNTSSRSIMS